LPKSRHRGGRPRTSTRSSNKQVVDSSETASPQQIDKTKIIIFVAIAALILAAGFFWLRGSKEVTTSSGLKYVDLVEGTGTTPKTGQTVKVHYTGTLENGTKFDSSRDRGTPFETKIGVGNVIKGWDEGLMTMKVGGRRKLIVPSKLGYGPNGQPPKIPGNATLIFDVELLDVK
jgi:peptidylprolyl isomerase